jgi:hypothetical protein
MRPARSVASRERSAVGNGAPVEKASRMATARPERMNVKSKLSVTDVPLERAFSTLRYPTDWSPTASAGSRVVVAETLLTPGAPRRSSLRTLEKHAGKDAAPMSASATRASSSVAAKVTPDPTPMPPPLLKSGEAAPRESEG